jgi:hypothetical protein
VSEKAIVFLSAAGILLGLFVVLFYSVRLQRKAVGTQDTTVSKVDESLALSRESVRLQREALQRMDDSLTLHRETNRLLAIVAKEPPS